jgi:hypothetical protein
MRFPQVEKVLRGQKTAYVSPDQETASSLVQLFSDCGLRDQSQMAAPGLIDTASQHKVFQCCRYSGVFRADIDKPADGQAALVLIQLEDNEKARNQLSRPSCNNRQKIPESFPKGQKKLVR